MRDAMLWLLLAVPLSGCPRIYPSHEPVEVPKTATPIDGLNTEWDDYNAAKPPGLDEIIFSTNRGSHGADLDVWTTGVKWGAQPRVLGEPRPLAPELMSPSDERGPLLMSHVELEAEGRERGGAALTFSSARDGGAGGLDLYWAEMNPPTVHRLEHLSSAANDAYMTHRFGEVMQARVLFASDRAGTGYDIYEATWSSYQIGGPPVAVKKVDALSSSADDTAPFVGRRGHGPAAVVFASKRDGGRGGWDLWCSHFDGTTYSPPVPLAFANTEHDEFRPSIADGDSRFLVFSSNRPGGRGGYDLYAAPFDGCR